MVRLGGTEVSLEPRRSLLPLAQNNLHTIVDTEREDTYQEGLPVANWAQIKKLNLAAISIQGTLMQTAL